MNPNVPLYGLGGGPNVNMLDSMLMAAGFQATDQPVVPKPALVPAQYVYSQDIHHHAMNLVQPQPASTVSHVTSGASDPVHVIVYQNDNQQQQPISYKIPQVGAAVVQNQSFVLPEASSGQASSRTEAQVHRVQYTVSQAGARPGPATHTTVRHVQSPAERKKDIVAQAMQEQKIFEENTMPKAEAVVKQEPGVPPVSTAPAMIPSGPDKKPVITSKPPPVKRQSKGGGSAAKQPVVQRVDLTEEEDDGLTCRLCLASYWYKTEMFEHYKSVHSIADPVKYDKEEKDKRMKKIKENQHRFNQAKKQRDDKDRKSLQRGRGMIKLTSPGARPTLQAPGQRPSFQYRDGAFICDLCKESFSDGNDMVTHWKSHVKKQQEVGGFSRGRGKGRGRGRPRRRSSSSSTGRRFKRSRSSSDSSAERVVRNRGKRGDKGKPRWTAYLLWSTRKRRDVVVDHPDWSFAQIAKWISEEWKLIDADEKDELQKEAEEMNELGIRKLPRDDDAPDPDKDTTDEDSDFEEGYRRKQKPIKLKIKKEKKDGEEGEDYGDEDSTESDWEPEADIVPQAREKSRSGRQRKRPSFFQEFESQENNLDSILAEFEQTQAAEFGKLRQPKPQKPPGERKPRKRRAQVAAVEPLEEIPVEVETLRSGRKRKVRRVMNAFMDEEDEDDKLLRGASSDDDDFEPPPDDEVEKLEDEDDAIEEEGLEEYVSDDLEESDDDRNSRMRDIMALPIKKRGRPKKILTDYEIEEATRAAMYTRPAIEITKVPRVYTAEGMAISREMALDLIIKAVERVEGPDPTIFVAKKSAPALASSLDSVPALDSAPTIEDDETPKFQWVNETLNSDDDDANKMTRNVINDKVAFNPLADTEEVPDQEKNPLGDDELEKETVNEEEALLETASAPSEQPPFVNECREEESKDQSKEQVTVIESDNPLGDIDHPMSDKTEGNKSSELDSGSDPFSEDQDKVGGVLISEEDILTGPAHNLDDSQYKADYVDPNLEDIFK